MGKKINFLKNSKKSEEEQIMLLEEGKYAPSDVSKLRAAFPIWKECDIYEAQMKELFEIRHPSLKWKKEFDTESEKYIKKQFVQHPKNTAGNWVYYPWSGVLIHMLPRAGYHELLTNRNKDLITKEEQKKLSGMTIAFAGLSVGSNIASALAHSGIGRTMKLAEYDTLETTNLNRIRAKLEYLGNSKLSITRNGIHEMNPYLKFIEFPEGINKNTIEKFVFGKPSPDVIFEIIDNFEMKIHLRLAARKARIPVIMMANLGDSLLVDVERYDLDPNTPLFNGVVGDIDQEILAHPDFSDADKHRYAVKLVGVENIPERALRSVKEIGKTLVGRPQLATTVTISGGIGAYLVKRIGLGLSVPSGRKLVKFDEFFIDT